LTDWQAIEREYRTTAESVSAIARRHGITHTAINKRAKRDGWIRLQVSVSAPTRQWPRVETTPHSKPAKPPKPPQHNRGVLTPRKQMDRVLERLAEGGMLKAICAAPGMPSRRTVRDWVSADRDGFAEAYTKARALGIDAMADEIIQIADADDIDVTIDKDGKPQVSGEAIARAKLRVDARKWILAKLDPARFSDRVTVGGEINVNVSTLSEEELLTQALTHLERWGYVLAPRPTRADQVDAIRRQAMTLVRGASEAHQAIDTLLNAGWLLIPPPSRPTTLIEASLDDTTPDEVTE
jgi:hypothetical protein